MENYFLQCKKQNIIARFGHSSLSADACCPLSGEAIEERKLPGVAILRFNWEFWPLYQITPVANGPPSPLLFISTGTWRT